MTGRIFLFLAFPWPLAAQAQVDSLALHYAETITETDLREYLTELSSDAYEGRETGLPGQKKAMDYLQTKFGSFGIGPIQRTSPHVNGYLQPFDLVIEQPGTMSLNIGGKAYKYLEDVLYFSSRITTSVEFQQVVLTSAGGVADVPEGTRVILVLAPTKGAGDEAMNEQRALGQAAAAKGVELVLYCTDGFQTMKDRYAHWLGGTRTRLADDVDQGTKKQTQTMMVTPAVAEGIMANAGRSFKKEWARVQRGKRTKRKALVSSLGVVVEPKATTATGENVLAYIPGSDKKEELVIITAHYDHIGTHDGEVYNGADDDGSGTVALLEMAQAFARARAEGHGPRRSMLFMPVSGEEKGLLGSEYYSEHPVFPIEQTVADLNIDMIGRVDSAHASSGPYVYIIGSDRLSTELHRINDAANKTYTQLDLDQAFNAHDDPNRFYFRSDHYNFARKGIPVIFYFSGVHEDYHQPTDEVEKIRFDLLRQRALLVFHTAWILANREDRIVVDGQVEKD